jgi:exopolyphosphatase/guanosine-5'-triphosphate,3'-diphosphate pyrophosphatase
MSAVFEELEIGEMRYCPAALREGVLYDLLGRDAGADMREITVAQMRRRYAVDEAHGRRVANTALALYDQAARGVAEQLREHRELLRWTAELAEVGMSIAHEDFHRHGSYILRNADMPGFTRSEQSLMSIIALGQVGGLRKMRELVSQDSEWLMILCLRLASILHRRRDIGQVPLPALFLKRRKVRLELPQRWAFEHPLSDATLAAEEASWNELGVFEEFSYVRI